MQIPIIIAIFIFLAVLTGLFLRRKSPPKPALQEEISKSKPAETPQSRWDTGLKKSRDSFWGKLQDAVTELSGGESWNDKHPIWEKLEMALLGADIGPRTTELLLQSLRSDFPQVPSENTLKEKLRSRLVEILNTTPSKKLPEVKPLVTILVGVNGAGKTTTAGKLAYQSKESGKTVILGAADTFRAAAVEQLKIWAERIACECITPAHGANPAAVAFDAVAAGLARNADEIIIDTAGRLHTKDNLMEELKKLIRVIDKKIPGAPHRILLVLDATQGQNAIAQAKEFTAAVSTTGVVLTKLDGSAKGGAIFSVSADLGIPIEYVGLGEGAQDLQAFSAQEFVKHLLP